MFKILLTRKLRVDLVQKILTTIQFEILYFHFNMSYSKMYRLIYSYVLISADNESNEVVTLFKVIIIYKIW